MPRAAAPPRPPFVQVATARVKGAAKLEIPHVDDHVSKIDCVGLQVGAGVLLAAGCCQRLLVVGPAQLVLGGVWAAAACTHRPAPDRCASPAETAAMA